MDKITLSGDVEVERADGGKFRFSLLEAYEAVRAISQAHPDDNAARLEAVRQWFAEHARASLTRDEADELADEITLLYTQKKTERSRRLVAMHSSPPSTRE